MTETKIGCVQHDCEKCKALEAQVNTCGSGAGCLHKDARIEALEGERDAALARIAELTYASTQATKCACCGVHKHTPLRVDFMGGYVCLTCIDMRLEVLDDTANLYAKQVAHWIAKHDAALARIAEIEKQKPMIWVSDLGSGIETMTSHKFPQTWTPLYAAAGAGAQPSIPKGAAS